MTTEPIPTAPDGTLGVEQFDELDTILDDLRTRDDEIPQWEFCEGFMAALVCCRRSLVPAEYLPVLLGFDPAGACGTVVFSSTDQFERFMTLWTQRWNEIATALDLTIESLNDDGAYQPEVMDVRGAIAALPPEERAEMGDAPVPSFGQIWAIGFMYAVENWAEEWEPPNDPDAAKLINGALECIVTLTEDDTAELTIGAFEEDGEPTMSEQRLNDFADGLWAVYDLREAWLHIGPRIETVYRVETPGRNDMCSCGSGKKYKKCCGAN